MKKVVLKNGARALVDSDMRFHSVALVLYLEGGLQDETESTVGLSHILEHLLFKRTSQKDTAEIACAMDELGGDINAFTDTGGLSLHGVVPAENCYQLLELFAELLSDCQFTEADLQLEKDIIRQEILESLDDPGDLVFQNLNSALWPESVIGYPVFGTFESLETFTEEDVRDRLRVLLTGKRLIVAASGAIDTERFVCEVERLFGKLPSGEWQSTQVPETKTGMRFVNHPVHQVHFALARPFPLARELDNLKGLIFAGVFGDGMSSRLFQRLREEHGIAYDVGAFVEGVLDRGLLLISGTVERESIEHALLLIVQELEDLRQHYLREDELLRIRRLLIAQIKMEADSLSSRLWRMIETDLIFGTYVSCEEVLEKISKITLTEMREFIEKWVTLDQYTIVLGGNVEGIVLPEHLLRLCRGPLH